MKKLLSITLCVFILFASAACGSGSTAGGPWTREGYFLDENGYMLSITRMDDVTDPGWYVGVMLGEDFIEDSWGGILPEEGNTLRGVLPSSGSKADLTVTVSEEGKDGILLKVEGGETYRFTSMGDMTASIIVTINTEGSGNIDYAEGTEAPQIDTEYPYQSAQINLGEPATHTFAAWPNEGFVFVKWTKNGADFSTEPVITVLLDESADFVAVFEAKPN